METRHQAPGTRHALVFANGALPDDPASLPAYDLLIAADGGVGHVFSLGLVPDHLVGDMDSVTDEEVARVAAGGGQVHRFDADKNETDLELALDFAVRSGAGRITCLGLTGGRLDMTIANLMLIAGPKYAGIDITAVAGDTWIRPLRGGERLAIDGRPGDVVSVVPVGGPAGGLTYEGLAWPLQDAGLPFGSPRGVSNELESGSGAISLKDGTVLIIVRKETR